MASELLERLSEDLEVFSEHARTALDEFGTLLAYLEGAAAGERPSCTPPTPRPSPCSRP
jgi:hypothetical protein